MTRRKRPSPPGERRHSNGSAIAEDPRQGERRAGERRGWPRRWNDTVLNFPRRYIYGIPAFVLFLGALFALWAFWLEPSRLVVRRYTMAIPGWPATERPLKVAFLGDFHVGAPYMTEEKMRTVVNLVNRQKPDLIALLGDYVILGVLGGRLVRPEDIAHSLRGLQAPLGVFAVLGNHDWWYDGFRVHRALEDVGYDVLEDEATVVDFLGQRVRIAGLGDEMTRHPNPDKVLSADLADMPTVVLTHSPDLFPQIPKVLGPVLAAHTHGGQVRFPLMGAPIVPSRYRDKYAWGLIESEGRRMIVTSGLGTSVLPVRFRVPPEIALLEIVGSPSEPPGNGRDP